ncbi:hypothetical protein [Lacticaseibacillus baoqingensis]|uniref:hypothetical protein n=1 Tax=Lacticaseibacillus baoqingensis TaxID=2486013 RepID=UPI0013DDA541|nr:hypothetical protein [Lacticaseibacillus baoqingensis]
MISYNSPIVFSQSILVFLSLIRIKVNKPIVQKVLRVISPATLGVYIIDSSLFYTYVLPNLFSPLANESVIVLISVILGSTVALFLLFCGLDLLRIWLFKLSGVDSRIDAICTMFLKIAKAVRYDDGAK